MAAGERTEAQRQASHLQYEAGKEDMRLRIGMAACLRAEDTGDKVAARQAANALLVPYERPKACRGCGLRPKDGVIEAHHDDYFKPLQVRYLCRSCHREAHTRLLDEQAQQHVA
ncbi:MAG: hypothetical protein Q7W51_08835 [Coriobacteriia bacterium]|nr:hypothetical protein [Coriobacteriia bacterium]